MATNNVTNTSRPITVAQGGTGVATLTTYAPLCGGTTSTAALQQATTGIGSSGFVLTSQGASALPQWSAQSGGGAITLLHTLTASSSSTLTFTSTYITSAFTSYMIVINNITGSALGAATMSMIFSTNNGSTYLSTNYESGFLSWVYNSTTTSVTSATANGVIMLGVQSSVGASGVIYINIPQSAVVSYVGKMGTTPISTSSRSGYCYGTNSGTTTVNNIQFSLSASQTMTSGTISLYSISQ